MSVAPVEEVVTYYDLPDDTIARDVADAHDRDAAGNHPRLDAAGLDADGEVVVALEAERINNDHKEAIPQDYGKMAACDPDEAIWIVFSRAAGHTIIDTLTDAGHLDTTYANSTPPHHFSIDTPGLTEIQTITHLTDRLQPAD